MYGEQNRILVVQCGEVFDLNPYPHCGCVGECEHFLALITDQEHASDLSVPKFCPECQDSGVCQNRFKCLLACWFCGGQMGLFRSSTGVQA